MALDNLEGIFTVIGLLASGGAIRDLLAGISYYVRNKSWPPALLEVEKKAAAEINSLQLELIETKNAELRAQISEAKSDLEDLWKKAFSKL